jgi:hypothetical protein
VWFAHFSALYGIASFGQAAGASPASFNAAAWALTAAACVAVAVAWRRSQRLPASSGGSAQGVQTVAAWLALLSLAGILFQALVLAIVP